jgi:hypothetical protein
MNSAAAEGRADLDHSALVTVYESLANLALGSRP